MKELTAEYQSDKLEFIKNPVIAEFLGLALNTDFTESDLEKSILSNLQYIRMYDELRRSEGDNPTIGIVLCADTDEDIAKYSVLHGNEQLFASKYKLYLPTEEELRAEIETQKAIFYLQQNEKRNMEI